MFKLTVDITHGCGYVSSSGMNRGACMQAAAMFNEAFILHRCSSLDDPTRHGQQLEVPGGSLLISDQLSNSSWINLNSCIQAGAFSHAVDFGVLVCRTNAR